MEIKLIAFGIAKDILEQQHLSVEIQKTEVNIQALKAKLLEEYPAFSKLKMLSFAVNEEYQKDDFLLKDQDEVVIIPPVSGG